MQQVSLNPGNINCNIVNKSGIVTPSASAPTATGVSPAPTATSPQSSSMAPTGPESQMLVQLSNHQSDGVSSPHFLLANTNQKSGLVSQQMMTGSLNQSTLNNKLRQQRKQSLK